MGTVSLAGLRTGPEIGMKQTGKRELPRYSSILGFVATLYTMFAFLSRFMMSLKALDGNTTS